jgi:hypothetical protein
MEIEDMLKEIDDASSNDWLDLFRDLEKGIGL